MDVISFLNAWKCSLVKPSGPGGFLVEGFFFTDSIYLIDIRLLRLHISSCVGFSKLYFSRHLLIF